MLRKIDVGLEPLNQTLAWAKENGVQDWFQTATHNFKTYEHRWETG